MTELRTLKDIDSLASSSDTIGKNLINSIEENYRFSIKQEAIKWVKLCGRWNIDVRIFMDFFNITEEDLK
jgi:hypothetical protein